MARPRRTGGLGPDQQFLRNLMEEKQLSVAAFAKIAGVAESTVSNWSGGDPKRKHVPKTAYPAIMSTFNVTAEEILAGKRLRQVNGHEHNVNAPRDVPGAKVPRTVPVVSWGELGGSMEALARSSQSSPKESCEYYRDTVLALTVMDDSMSRARAPAGTTIFFDYMDRQLRDGGLYIVRINDKPVFRRYRANPTRFEPDSLQGGYDTFFPQHNDVFEVLGFVFRYAIDPYR